MKIAIYSRKSKFSETGDSVENQIQYCIEYANIHFRDKQDKDFLLYEDEGYSAATTDRPQFLKLMDEIKQRKINMLLCYRLDRISRSVADFSETLKLLEKYDVSFVSATEHFDTSTPMGKAMIYIASVFAQLERETIAERVRDNMLALAKSGRWLGGITPLGFQSEAITYLDSELKERQLYRLIPVDSELHIAKTLFYKYLELGSLSKVEKYCLNNNIKTINNCSFTKNAISMIIQNPTYCIADNDAYGYFTSLNCILPNDSSEYDGTHGLICYNRNGKTSSKQRVKHSPDQWIIAIAKHCGVISGSNYITVQNNIQNNRSKASPRTDTSSYSPLSGLIICKECGNKMRIKSIKKTPKGVQYYYICELKTLSSRSKCSIKNINGPHFDTALTKLIKDILENCHINNQTKKYLRQRESSLLHNENETEYNIIQLQSDYKANSLKIKEALLRLDHFTSPTLEKHIYELINQLEEKQTLIKKRIDKITELSHPPAEEKEISKQFHSIIDINHLIDQLDIPSLKRIFRTFIRRIYWDGNTAKIDLVINSHYSTHSI